MRQLNRLVSEELGAGPLALARAQRAQTARTLIETTELGFAEVAFAAGFASVRQFNDTVREVFALTPRELRQRRGKPNAASAPDKGSCIWAEGTDSNHPKIHKVDCSDPKAQYTVLSKITGGDDSACDNVPGTDASYTETNHSKPVYVLCLQQTK